MKTGLYAAMVVGAFSLVAFAQDDRQERGGERGQVNAKSARIPLKFEKGKEYVFRVEMEGKQSGQPGQQQQSGQAGQSGQQQQSGQGTGQSGPFSLQTSGGNDFDYRILVKDTSGGQSTLEVTLQRSSGQRESERRDQPGATSPGTAREESRDKSQGPGQKFNVKVDQDGRLVQGEGLEEITGSRGGQSPGAMFTESMVRSQLRLILGTGLHSTELQPGKTYSLAGQQSGQSGQSGQQQQAGSQSFGNQGMDILDKVQLRYEGTTKQDQKELAKFSVITDQSQGTPSPSAGRPGEPGSSGAQSGEDRSRPSQATSREQSGGEATYHLDDGLVHRMTVQGQFTQSGSTTPSRFWLSIKRVHDQEKDGRSGERKTAPASSN